MHNREVGYYWVRLKGCDYDWDICAFGADGRWYTTSDILREYIRAEELAEIGDQVKHG